MEKLPTQKDVEGERAVKTYTEEEIFKMGPFAKTIEYLVTKRTDNYTWQAYVRQEDGTWMPLRVTETSFDSAQIAVYDDILKAAFPREKISIPGLIAPVVEVKTEVKQEKKGK